MLTKLNQYGVRGVTLNWTKNYLTDRQQKKANMVFFLHTNPLQQDTAGVYVLSSLLFILVENDVFQF